MRVNLRGRSFLKLFALAGQFLLYTIIVLLSGLPVFGQSGTIALVQHASKDAGSSSSSTLAFGANNTAGNWIAVCVRAGAINEVISVSDTRGNIYRKAVQFNQTVDGFSGAIYYAEGIAGGANTVTVADSISGTLRFSILEYSGVATSGSLDAGAAAQGHSTSPSTAPSVNTTVNGDLLIGTVMSGNSDSFTAGPGYKIEESVPGQGNAKLIVEDQIQSIAGATTASVTLGSADDWAAGLAAFKAANGTGGTTPTITGLSPTSGVTGTSVVITGTSFGSTQGTSTVKFNGISTTPTFWNSTSITAPVPTGATTGSVIVTVNGLASNGVNFTVSPPPSVTINQAATQADPTNASPINFTAVFSAAVTGFSSTGVTLGGTAGATTAVVTGSGTTYNVAVSGMTQTGTVIASIPAGVATANGASNTASTSTDNTVTYDITPPTVTVNQAASQTDPTGTSPINFTAVFSKTVTGFSSTGVTLGGTAGATTAVVTGSGTTYNIAVSGMTQSGTVIASIPAGKATDPAGNLNTASTSTDNTVTYNPQSGLVAAYSFEEGTGTTTADSSGNNNTGTLSTGVTWTTGKIGNAVAFNGTSGDITINEAPSLDLSGSFSLSAWVKPAVISGTETLLIKETTSGCGYFVQIVNNGQIDSGFNNGSGCIEHITTNANMVAGNWYNLTVVLDHSNNVYNSYLNGNLIASVAETGVPVPNTQPLVLGRSGCSGCGFERLNGVLDEVKVYSRALAAAEVLTLYNAATGGPTITGLSPTSGVTGTSVVITGTSFGSTQGTSTVKFNGISTTPTFWNSTSITAPVPTGATTGSVIVTVNGLASNGVNFTVNNLAVAVSPKRAAVTLTQTQQFVATVTNDPLNGGVSWSVDGVGGGTSTSGTVSATGLFTPGTQPGVHTVKAASNSNPSTSASSSVAVTDLAGVFTYHNDNARTGQNIQEYALTTSTVNASTFGALFTCTVDGYLYAAPLYVPGLSVGGQTRNVVFLATEHDTVYAFDADSPACVQLWKTNFLSNNVTTVPPGDTGAGTPDDLTPEIGITSTPVIDPSSKTIYVMAKTKETTGTGCSTGNPCYVHRLHALDLITGAEKFGGPVVVSAPNFIPLFHLQRPALLLNNGSVYVAFGSHGDSNTWQGWLMAYNASTLVQQWVWHSTDPTSGDNEGAIWGSGNGPALDATGNIYVETGNGYFDGANNFSDSVVKLSPAGVRLDYFTPFDQSVMQSNDIDLGSSNPIILPDSVGSTAHPHLMIATGKVGVIYLLDQTNMGGYNSAANQDVGEVSVGFNTSNFNGGFYGQPAYWNGNLYTVIVGDSLRQYLISGGNIMAGSSSNSSNTFPYRGATPAVSASGTTNGIVWVADITAYQFGTALILDAYDATNVSRLLYSSPASGTGAAAPAAKFTVPTVANGKVYVGGEYAFTVFGLLPN